MPQPQVDSAEQDQIRRVREGDKEAFYCLVRPYERVVFFAAKWVLGNDADAKEAAQEAVLKAFLPIKTSVARASSAVGWSGSLSTRRV